MISKWLKNRRIKKECHRLNSEYHEVMRMDNIPYRFYSDRKHSAVMLINGYGEREVVIMSTNDSEKDVRERSPWYKLYGKPWEVGVSNVIDHKGTKLENYNTFYIQDGTIFRKTIKPVNGNAYVIDGDV